ncbi:MAG: hypothetical protein AB7K35_05735, partial [Pseudorhodoplanes sp.]
MPVLSIDLAHKSYNDIGAAILKLQHQKIVVQFIEISLNGKPCADRLAEFINILCDKQNIEIVIIDGAQGWRMKNSPLIHSRQCERELNTPAKSGEPFVVRPRPYLSFVTFSIALFDRLSDLGWHRMSSAPFIAGTSKVLIESFPRTAWRSLQISPLPSKRKAKRADLEERIDRLKSILPLHLSKFPNHDELQALASGIAGLWIEQNEWHRCKVSGVHPRSKDNH